MKKLFFYLAAASAVLAGCAKTEIDVEIPIDAPVVVPAGSFVGTFAINEGSKTSIVPGEENYNVYWEEDDRIQISNDGGTNYYDFKIDSTSVVSVQAVFVPVDPTEIPEDFFSADSYKAKFGDEKATSFEQSASDNVKHLPMTAEAGSDRNLVFSMVHAVLAVNIPANVSAKSVKVAVRGGSDVSSVSSSSALTAFYVPVPAGSAQYNISAYSGENCSNEIAESMKMQVSASMSVGDIYPFTFTPTLEITSEGTHKMKSYPADYKVHILDELSDVTVTYADGATQHPANVYINANEKAVASLTINTADSHVEIEKGNSANVTSKTSKNSFVVKPTYYINTIELEKGSVVVECKKGTDDTKVQRNVEKIVIPSESTTIGISINVINEGLPVRIENSAPTAQVSVVGEENHEYDYEDNYQQKGQNPVAEVSAVATVGNVRYATLEGAVAAAKTGETVTLAADAALPSGIEVAGKEITLDLGTFNVTYSGSELIKGGLFIVHNGAGLTIDGTTGSIVPGNKAYGAVTMTKKDDNANVPAKLTVNGGTLTGNYYAVSGNGNRHNTEIVINGGSLTATDSESTGIYNPQNGSIVITGGSITAANGVYIKSGCVASFTGGTVHATGAKGEYQYSGDGYNSTGDAFIVDNCKYPGGRPTVMINGGTLISDNAFQVGAYYMAPETGISDIFSTANNLTVPSGYVWSETETSGVYKLEKTSAVAKIGTTTYPTLEAAVEAATAGQTITLIADIPLISTTGNKYLRFKDNVILDLNEHTINNGKLCKTYWDYSTGNAYVFEGEGIKIKNGTITGTANDDGYCYAVYIGNDEDGNIPTSNVTIENVTCSNGGINMLNATDVLIKDCDVTVQPTQYYAVYVGCDGAPSASATINGGTYRCGTSGTVVLADDDNGASLSIVAGTFNAEPNASYVAPGYEAVAQGTTPETWKVQEAAKVAKVGTTEYSDLHEALVAAKTAGKTCELLSDVDLNGVTWTPITDFAGTLDGKGYTISNLTVNGAGCLGLIGSAPENGGGVVKNLTITNANITGTGNNVAVVFGSAFRASINNVSVTNSTVTSTGEYVGAITGGTYADVEACSVSNTSITGLDQVGSVVGYLCGADLKNCSVTNNTVKATHATEGRAGALIGKAGLDDSAYAVYVSGNTISGGSVEATYQVGGIAGQMFGDGTPAYYVQNNSIDVKLNGTGTKCPIANLRSSVTEAFCNLISTNITGNTWTENTDNVNVNSYTYPESQTKGAGDQVVWNGSVGNIAKIGSENYTTLAAALKAAQSGNTIEILDGNWGPAAVGTLTTAEALQVRYKSLTIQPAAGANPTFTSKVYFGYNDSGTANATITVKNLNFVNAQLCVSNYVQATVEGCTFKNSDKTDATLLIRDACCTTKKSSGTYPASQVTVKDCVVDGSNVGASGIRIVNSGNVSITGTTVKNSLFNGILFESNSSVDNTAAKTVAITGNNLTNWNAGNAAESGRALRMAMGTMASGSTITIENNVFEKATLGFDKPDFVKLTEAANATISLENNYWNGMSVADFSGKSDYYTVNGSSPAISSVKTTK